jgi:hypothetical protein
MCACWGHVHDRRIPAPPHGPCCPLALDHSGSQARLGGGTHGAKLCGVLGSSEQQAFCLGQGCSQAHCWPSWGLLLISPSPQAATELSALMAPTPSVLQGKDAQKHG